MFNNDDFPFSAMGRMHSQMMRDMDMMMDGMMSRSMAGSFGMFPRMSPFGFPDPFAAITDGSGYPPSRRRAELEMNPFSGFGGLLNQMEHGAFPSGGNMIMQSTVMTMGPDGNPHVQQKTMRKSGDVTETKSQVHKDGESHLTHTHSIGDRAHVVEKKRDKDGNIRKQQKLINLDEEHVDDFNREFEMRIKSNHGRTRHNRENLSAIGYNGPTSSRSSGAPIVTLPEEDDVPEPSHSNQSRIGGPVIREISEEEAEQANPKRRRGPFGMFRAE